MTRLDIVVRVGLVVVSAGCGASTDVDSAVTEPAHSIAPPTTAIPVTTPTPTTPALPNPATTSTTPLELLTWRVEDNLEVVLRLPTGWEPDTSQGQPSDVDVANGLFVLQRWAVPGSPSFATLSVQRDPGDDAPVHSVPAFREVTTPAGQWRLVAYGDNDGVVVDDEPVVAFARIDGYLFEVSGTEAHVDVLLPLITITSRLQS